MGKESFLFHDEFWEVFAELDLKQRGLMLTAMREYHANGDSDYLKDPALRLAFVMIRNAMCRDRAAYAAKCASAAENIRKRWNNESEKYGRIRSNTDVYEAIPDDTKNTDKDMDMDLKRKEPKGSKRKVFLKPSVEEVQAYCSERKNGIQAEKFWNYYEAKGWLIGKAPMKDWKAAVRTWEGNRNVSVNIGSTDGNGGLMSIKV